MDDKDKGELAELRKLVWSVYVIASERRGEVSEKEILAIQKANKYIEAFRAKGIKEVNAGLEIIRLNKNINIFLDSIKAKVVFIDRFLK